MAHVETTTNWAGWKTVAVFTGPLESLTARLIHHRIFDPAERLDFCRAHGGASAARPDQTVWFPVGERCPACQYDDEAARAEGR